MSLHHNATLIAAAATLLLAGMPAASQQAAKADIRAEIAKRLDVKPEEVQPSPVTGLYEVVSGTEIGYVSTDGRYYLDGDVFEIASRDNLTERRRDQGRLAMLAGLNEADAIVFGPRAAPRHTITVFTDIDCSYCRRLHTEIDELNKLGIRVRYLAYPRSGPDTDSWRKAEAVWCSPDRRDALTRAKRGEETKSSRCANPVAKEFQLGKEMGIRGTPGIITDRGEYIAGYMPAARLAEYLDGAKTAKR